MFLIGVVAFASPAANAMSVTISPTSGSSFKAPQTAVFQISLSIQSGELVPISGLTATVTGVGTPNAVSTTSPSFPATQAVTQFSDPSSPFLKAVSAGAFNSAQACGSASAYGYGGFQGGYGSGYGCGIQGPATNHYTIQVSTSVLAQMAGLTKGQSGTFTLQITVHTSLTPTSDFQSTPVTFTITAQGH